MIADEIDGPGPAKAKAITPKAYNRLKIGALAAVWAVAIAVDLTARVGFRLNTFPFLAVVAGASQGLAGLAVDAWLRRRGLSRAGRSFEAWTRVGGASPGGTPTDEVVEVRIARDTLMAVSVMSFIVGFALVVATAALAYHLSGTTFTPNVWGPTFFLITSLATILAGLAGIWYLHEGMTNPPRYRLDDAGIAGLRAKPPVPWSAVASYRVTTHRDILGRPVSTTHDLLGRDGKALLRLRLDDLAPGDGDRLLASIAARFPKPVKDDRDGRDL